jgi:large subunit ribosomal protein L32
VAVPKKQTTSRRSKQRRAHDALKNITLVKCPKCGEEVLPHTACATCGYYGDKKVLNIDSKLDKKLKKQQKEQKEE